MAKINHNYSLFIIHFSSSPKAAGDKPPPNIMDFLFNRQDLDAFFFAFRGTKKKALQKRNAVFSGLSPEPHKPLKRLDRNFHGMTKPVRLWIDAKPSQPFCRKSFRPPFSKGGGGVGAEPPRLDAEKMKIGIEKWEKV